MKLTGQRNQCPTCKFFFNSNSAFDFHRTGSHEKHERRCLTALEMTKKGMVIAKSGFWVSKEGTQTRFLASTATPNSRKQAVNEATPLTIEKKREKA